MLQTEGRPEDESMKNHARPWNWRSVTETPEAQRINEDMYRLDRVVTRWGGGNRKGGGRSRVRSLF